VTAATDKAQREAAWARVLVRDASERQQAALTGEPVGVIREREAARRNRQKAEVQLELAWGQAQSVSNVRAAERLYARARGWAILSGHAGLSRAKLFARNPALLARLCAECGLFDCAGHATLPPIGVTYED
jgi:hypothetical protein